MFRVPRARAFEQDVLLTQRRLLKTLTVREYKPLGTPREFKEYQRITNNPIRQSGVQFLTHYDTFRRFDVRTDYIDYLRWGREQGQAHLPHRHHRVAFDHHDALHPTVMPSHARRQNGWFEGGDPSMRTHKDVSTTFNPKKKLFSHPEHFNALFTVRRPGQGDIRLAANESNNLLWPVVSYSQTVPQQHFGVTNLTEAANAHGSVPGIHRPFRGETDEMMMQAMSRPLTEDQTISSNEGRFSKILYLNNPGRSQVLEGSMTKNLEKIVDESCNAVHSKLVVLKAAQSGETDFFCNTVDMERLSLHLRLANDLRAQAVQATGSKGARQAQELLHDAVRHETIVDEMLRDQVALLWRIYTAPRPLMTFVNGKARGVGCGVALLSKYPALRDSTELIFDGPDQGLTPFGGLTQLLARAETSLKYPGLAEYVMLSGTALYAGDCLRLGWSDLFTTLKDMDYHIKEWFDATEHMHNDAVAWQLGQLLDTCFKMKDCHQTALERAAISKQRALWVEDAFADQPSVEAILATLSQMEKLSLSDPLNTSDASGSQPFTTSVEEGLQLLASKGLGYGLDPWDLTPLDEKAMTEDGGERPPEQQHMADVFLSYHLERRGSETTVVHKNRDALRQWRKQRYNEFKQFKAVREMAMPRHVFARLEGCEGKVVDFEFVFDRTAAVAAMKAANTNTRTPLTDDDTYCALVQALKAQLSSALFGTSSRNIAVGWCLPTFETCELLSDAALQKVLFADPGVEDPQNLTKYPPLYLVVQRSELRLSEWAYGVKHKLLLQSPFALKASLQMLQRIRGDGAESSVQLLPDALATEFRYMRRMVVRPDFYQTGYFATLPYAEWEKINQDQTVNIHKAELPVRPMPTFNQVFERDAVIDGHRFSLRPRWSPRTLAEVSDVQVLSLNTELSFGTDSATEMFVATATGKSSLIEGMVDDIGGFELVPRLGEKDAKNGGKPVVPPLASTASVPTDVDFYRAARHPWTDVETSWRYDGFTELSQELFERKYKQADKEINDTEGRGASQYWVSKEASEGIAVDKDEALLKDRFFNVLKSAESSVENWAKELRAKASREDGVQYPLESTTVQEKVYDDEYYRWFVQPGVHPNPSGVIRGGAATASAGRSSKIDSDIEALMQSLAAPLEEAGNASAVGSSGADGAEGESATAGDGTAEEPEA